MKKEVEPKMKMEHLHLVVSPLVKELAKQKADEMFGGNLSALFAHLMYLENSKQNISGGSSGIQVSGIKNKIKSKLKK